MIIKTRSYYEELADSADLYENMVLTEDHDCPPDILDRYYDDMNHKIRYNVAGNHNTSKETLIKMYDRGNENGDKNTITILTLNPNCPVFILEQDSFIRSRAGYVSSSSACPDNLKMAIRSYLWLTY